MFPRVFLWEEDIVKYKKGTLIASVLILLIVIGIGVSFLLSEEQEQIEEWVEVDFTNIDSAVANVLKEMPEIQAELDEIRRIDDKKALKDSFLEVPIEDLFRVEKRQFRLEVENQLTNQFEEDMKVVAKEMTKNDLKALSIAEEEYHVTVSQAEVNAYIEKHIAPVVVKEKEAYAQALGLTLYELDYAFDRDIYVMDTLWSKLNPVLYERYPQQEGENANDYLDRIKRQFYSN